MSVPYFVRSTGELFCMAPVAPQQQKTLVSAFLGLPGSLVPEVRACGKGFLVDLRGPAEEAHLPTSYAKATFMHEFADFPPCDPLSLTQCVRALDGQWDLPD